jgi:hypothetical protein
MVIAANEVLNCTLVSVIPALKERFRLRFAGAILTDMLSSSS